MSSPAGQSSPPSLWKWGVCGLLLLATMINYMDRLTLNLVAKRVKVEYANNQNILYGRLEAGFGLAFAAGSVASGLIVDRFGARLYYPLMVFLWSAAGFATGFARSYEQFFICRTLLGFFEGANWPCALYTTQKILPARQRTMGNGILQSGAALGAIFTPLIVDQFLAQEGEAWRYPFMIIGGIGALWVVLWLALIRPATIPSAAQVDQPAGASIWSVFADRRFWVLAFVVVAINATWHFFRAWMPLFLQEQHGYLERQAARFSIPYYVATDVGSLTAGALTLFLVRRGLSVHASRMTTYFLYAALALSTVAAAMLPRGWTLLAVLLVVGFAALGVFPTYYSFTQELSAHHQGKVTGALGCICWVAMAALQAFVGWLTDAPGGGAGRTDYTLAIALAGVPPLLGFVALALFWRPVRSVGLAQIAAPENAPESVAAAS